MAPDPPVGRVHGWAPIPTLEPTIGQGSKARSQTHLHEKSEFRFLARINLPPFDRFTGENSPGSLQLQQLQHQFTIFHPQIGRFPLDLVSWPHQAPPLSCYSPGQILISLNDIIPEALLSRLAGPAGRSRPVIHRVGLSKITENRLSKRERFQNKRKTIIPQFTFSRLKIHVHTDDHNTLSLEMLGSSRQRPIGLRTFRVNLLQHSRPSISQCLLGCLGDNGEWHMNKHITSKFGSKPPDEKSSYMML